MDSPIALAFTVDSPIVLAFIVVFLVALGIFFGVTWGITYTEELYAGHYSGAYVEAFCAITNIDAMKDRGVPVEVIERELQNIITFCQDLFRGFNEKYGAEVEQTIKEHEGG